MDNRIFNVNGSGLGKLGDTLELAFRQWGSGDSKAVGFVAHPEHGIVLLWGGLDSTPDAVSFMAPLGPRSAAWSVTSWLQGPYAKEMKLTGWDRNTQHDGSNSKGWRVYCDDWGHVGPFRYAIVAITPAFMWHGK